MSHFLHTQIQNGTVPLGRFTGRHNFIMFKVRLVSSDTLEVSREAERDVSAELRLVKLPPGYIVRGITGKVILPVLGFWMTADTHDPEHGIFDVAVRQYEEPAVVRPLS